MDALGVLDHLPITARLSINIPYVLVTFGADWEAYRLALAHWILNVAPALSDGHHDIELPNTPLSFSVVQDSRGRREARNVRVLTRAGAQHAIS
jgi:hypothetical protein